MAAEPLKLKYANVEELVMTMLDVDPAHKKKVVARFKQLRNASFPPGVNVKTGRFLYDVDATMRVMLVFALMDSLVLPAQAMALLLARWPEIRKAIDAIAASLTVAEDEVQLSDRPEGGPFMVLATAALDHWAKPKEETLAIEGSGRLKRPGDLAILTEAELMSASAPAGKRLATGRIVLDLWTITSWTMERIVGRGWARPAQLGIPVV